MSPQDAPTLQPPHGQPDFAFTEQNGLWCEAVRKKKRRTVSEERLAASENFDAASALAEDAQEPTGIQGIEWRPYDDEEVAKAMRHCLFAYDSPQLMIRRKHTHAEVAEKKTGVADNASASRARFTAMTQVRDWLEAKAPGITVLFRVGDAACSLNNVRAALTTNHDALFQGAPKGSYGLEPDLEYLSWAVKHATEMGFSVCAVLDWFAPHLREEVDALCHALGHCVSTIGGGLTPVVQVGDTHEHRSYNQHYRDLEKDAASS
jgi:hypothetical protein